MFIGQFFGCYANGIVQSLATNGLQEVECGFGGFHGSVEDGEFVPIGGGAEGFVDPVVWEGAGRMLQFGRGGEVAMEGCLSVEWEASRLRRSWLSSGPRCFDLEGGELNIKI